jgi:GYF domain 2
MSNRSWFFASQGQQQGPYPEAQLRQFIATGTVTAETLIWSEGMAGWQKAGEIPGLFSAGSGPPPISQPGGPLVSAGGDSGGPLSIDVGLWSLLGRSLLFIIGLVLVVPAPWTATGFYRWMVSGLHVPGRPNLGFTGQVGDIWYVFVIIGLCTYAGLSGYTYVQLILLPVEAFLSWMVVRWIAANLSSNGERLPIEFKGSALGYVGWYLLIYISAITIIGWAWVATAWMRWICRNVGGTHREVVFNATGLGMLWRTILFAVACAFVIPIPWVLRWYARWYTSQFALVERTAYANA